MKKFIFFGVALLAFSSVVFGSYSYSVSGKVYYSVGGLPVSGATVTHTINFSGGGVASGNTMTANNGSFSFNVWSEALDYKGATMSLKATKGLCAGNTTWVCSSYSETKDVWISCTVGINPNLTVRVNPATFANPGIQPPSTTVAFLDAGPTVQITGFRTTISYDYAKIGVNRVEPAPDSFFDVYVESSGPGTITVYGYSAGPVPLMVGVPESFFDVFFEVSTTETPSFTSVLLEETTELYPYPAGGPALHPYPHRTENLIGTPEKCQPGLLLDSEEEWQEALDGSSIRPTSSSRWEQYMQQWNDPDSVIEGQNYFVVLAPTFVPCVDMDGTGDPGMLYAWGGGGGGGGGGALEDAGLVMAWKYNEQVAGNYASAWEWDYGMDPDLTNCTIQVTVTPPAPPPDVNSTINAVSFSIVDAAGLMRTWWWSVPNPIPLGVPTTVKINTAIQGVNAATPVATGYMNAKGFNIRNSQFFDVDENFLYIFQQYPVPPPGQLQPVWAWNYWHNLIVTKNTNAYKGTWVKYSQPPDVIDANDPPKINGWDERSAYNMQPNPIMADDWPCNDNRPVTDIHWWGSFIGWTQPYLPPVLPKGFHIGIWTDVPDPDPNDPLNFSHPGELIWEYRGTCTSWVWNFAGYDEDPRVIGGMQNEACFQFNQLLSEDEYFYQDPNENDVYWLSIAAIYNAGDEQLPGFHPWGWKTRPHVFNDDAVRITGTTDGLWPPSMGSVYSYGMPVQIPEYPQEGETWDLAFEITTNERPPCHTLEADLNHDCVVDLLDFAEFAAQWLETST